MGGRAGASSRGGDLDSPTHPRNSPHLPYRSPSHPLQYNTTKFLEIAKVPADVPLADEGDLQAAIIQAAARA